MQCLKGIAPKCLLRNRRHRSPATRCGRGELAPSPTNDRFRKRVGTSGRPQGCRPSAAFAAPCFTGLAPNVTFGSGVGTGRPGCGVGNRVARHPTNVVFRGRGRWTCPVHRPRSGMARTRETNDIDPLGRKAGDLVVRRRPTAASGSCSESHGNSGLGQQGGAARGSGGFQACRKRRAALFPARGYEVLPHIAPSFHGFRRSGMKSSSEQAARFTRF